MIENSTSPKVTRPLPEPNPMTRQAYRRQSFWQILLPLLVSVLLILALSGGVVWAAAGGLDEVSRWTDVSLIWLISPQLLFAFITLVFLCAMVFGLAKLLQVLPRYTHLLLEKMLLVQQVVRNISDKVVEPVLKLRSFKASADMLKHQITRLHKG